MDLVCEICKLWRYSRSQNFRSATWIAKGHKVFSSDSEDQRCFWDTLEAVPQAWCRRLQCRAPGAICTDYHSWFFWFCAPLATFFCLNDNVHIKRSQLVVFSKKLAHFSWYRQIFGSNFAILARWILFSGPLGAIINHFRAIYVIVASRKIDSRNARQIGRLCLSATVELAVPWSWNSHTQSISNGRRVRQVASISKLESARCTSNRARDVSALRLIY